MATAPRAAKPPPNLQPRVPQCSKDLDSLPSLRDGWSEPSLNDQLALSIAVMGASGDLAKKKTYPALFALYCKGFLPARLQVLGYARSPLSDAQLRDRLRPFLAKVVEAAAAAAAAATAAEAAEAAAGGGGESDAAVAQRVLAAERAASARGAGQLDAFLGLCSYQEGEYDDATEAGARGFAALAARMRGWEADHPTGGPPNVGRLLYLALPPAVYPQVCAALHRHVSQLNLGVQAGSWVRLILEKPFGRDLCSSEALAADIGARWPEEALYRIDHYLGKELVQNMLIMRFANTLFSSWWSRQHVANVQITFKENYGTQGRGGYFDQAGIIRDVIQNHLAQVLALLAMEPPVSLHPDDVRDEKVKLLRCVVPAAAEDCVLGQYVAANNNPGYKDDPTVPHDSITPTFASIRLFIHNDRWAGVPFIIKAGKALDDRTALVRIQLKPPPAPLFGSMEHLRNELVIRFQPDEAIYTKLVVKKPGLNMDYVMSELDLTWPERYRSAVIPDAYERLILDCMRGDQQHFVRRDELRAAWAIFTPLLHDIDAKRLPPPLPYAYGSRGPAAADKLVEDSGYTKTDYEWISYEKRRSYDGVGEGSKAEAAEAAAPAAAAGGQGGAAAPAAGPPATAPAAPAAPPHTVGGRKAGKP